MDKIVIIGVTPPCPRCGLLSEIIERKVEELGLPVEISHWAYTDESAIAFAGSKGLVPGTAKDVAKIIGEQIDGKELDRIINNSPDSFPEEQKQYNKWRWSVELDNFLAKYQNKALEAGVMMTPVLIINSEIVHQGSVPTIGMIDKWLADLTGK